MAAVAECIHGFDEGLCDICYPRRAPEVARAVRAPRSSTRATTDARGASVRHTLRSAAQTAAASTLTLARLRLFHTTHISNLEAIALEGELRAAADVVPELDVSSATTRELRASAELPDGSAVSQRVPFAASARSARWVELVSGAAGSHWSDAARRVSPLEYVILAVPAPELGDEVIVSDGDAGATVTRFAKGTDAGTSLLRRAHAADPELTQVEVLGAATVPFSAVALIGVANDPMRDRVRELLRETGSHAPKLSVHPPWFQPE